MTGAPRGVVRGNTRMEGRRVDLLIYIYTVYAGTQSTINHMKTTRMFEHAERHRLPVVCWLDGGGARPHDMKVEGRGATPPSWCSRASPGWCRRSASCPAAPSPGTPTSPACATC